MVQQPYRRKQALTSIQADSNLSNVSDCLTFAQVHLNQSALSFGHGYSDAKSEAVSLVSHALGLQELNFQNQSLEQLISIKVTESQKSVFLSRLNLRCTQKQPLGYINGEINFHGLRFLCDERALIPRSLIAELLFEQLTPWVVEPNAITHVLDLCTGGGSLAIFAFHAFPNAIVWASDLSRDALDLARENLALHKIDSNQIVLIESDLFANIGTQRFNLIISNPPYVNAASMSELPAEFLKEPDGALGGGNDGMDIVKQIIAQAHNFLLDDGILVIEIGHEANHLLSALPDYEFAFVPVQAGEDMVVAITCAALIAGHTRLAKSAQTNKR